MLEAILVTARAIVQAADYLAGLERTAREIKLRRRDLARRANTLETSLRSYHPTARHNAPTAAALRTFGDALHDALRLVQSCNPQNQSGVVGGLGSLPYGGRRNLDMLVHAEETINRCIRHFNHTINGADRRPGSAAAPIPQVINYFTIHNHGNMVLQQHQPRAGGASSSALPSSQSPVRPTVETGFAVAIRVAMHRQQLRGTGRRHHVVTPPISAAVRPQQRHPPLERRRNDPVVTRGTTRQEPRGAATRAVDQTPARR